MSQEELPLNYARAIYKMALEEWSDWLDSARQKLSEDAPLARLLASADVAPAEKQRRLETLFPAESSPRFRQFLRFLVDKGHLDHLDDVIAAYLHVVERGPEVAMTYITSAVALTADERRQLEEKLRRRFGASLEFDYQVDPTLLGGLRVRVGDTFIDGSVVGRLETLRDRLAAK